LASRTRRDQIADAKRIDGDFQIRRRDAGSRESNGAGQQSVELVRLIAWWVPLSFPVLA
jgi:hypothetical protein